MGLIIDTCVFIAAERESKIIDFDHWQNYEDAYISAITVSELLMGVHFADSKARHIRRSAFVESIIANIPSLDFTTEAARIHSDLKTLIDNGTTQT